MSLKFRPSDLTSPVFESSVFIDFVGGMDLSLTKGVIPSCLGGRLDSVKDLLLAW